MSIRSIETTILEKKIAEIQSRLPARRAAYSGHIRILPGNGGGWGRPVPSVAMQYIGTPYASAAPTSPAGSTAPFVRAA